MLILEKRPSPSQFWTITTPVLAVVLTMIAGGVLFAMLGKNPVVAIRTIFWDPVFGEFAFYLRGQLLVKAGPLILISVGLSLGFRAGIWNIGAEGQYIIGAIFGAGVGLAFFPTENRLIFPVMVLAGAFGGWFWSTSRRPFLRRRPPDFCEIRRAWDFRAAGTLPPFPQHETPS